MCKKNLTKYHLQPNYSLRQAIQQFQQQRSKHNSVDNNNKFAKSKKEEDGTTSRTYLWTNHYALQRRISRMAVLPSIGLVAMLAPLWVTGLWLLFASLIIPIIVSKILEEKLLWDLHRELEKKLAIKYESHRTEYTGTIWGWVPFSRVYKERQLLESQHIHALQQLKAMRIGLAGTVSKEKCLHSDKEGLCAALDKELMAYLRNGEKAIEDFGKL